MCPCGPVGGLQVVDCEFLTDRAAHVAMNSEAPREGRRRSGSIVEADLFARTSLPPPQRRTTVYRPKPSLLVQNGAGGRREMDQRGDRRGKVSPPPPAGSYGKESLGEGNDHMLVCQRNQLVRCETLDAAKREIFQGRNLSQTEDDKC